LSENLTEMKNGLTQGIRERGASKTMRAGAGGKIGGGGENRYRDMNLESNHGIRVKEYKKKRLLKRARKSKTL